MKLKLLALIITIALVSSAFGFGSQPSPAQARVLSAEAAYVSCTEFGAAGYFDSVDGTEKKVGIFAYNIDTGTSLAFKFIAQGVSGSYGGSIKFAEQPAHSHIYVDISTYILSGTDFFNGWDVEQYFSGVVDCSASGFTGPAIPSTAVLKTISCDVAVFDEPGGKPVGDNRIKAGQTWYVLPGTTEVNGEKWVQVYVSGFGLPWIPARCVPGADTTVKTKPATVSGGGSVLTASSTGGLKPDTTPH